MIFLVVLDLKQRHISLEALEHIIDMDMLHNTQDFLFERLLQCEIEKQLKSVHDKHSSKFKGMIIVKYYTQLD